jgi:hypothetical protein
MPEAAKSGDLPAGVVGTVLSLCLLVVIATLIEAQSRHSVRLDKVEKRLKRLSEE